MMGRRALRKISPSLDLSTFLFELDDLPQPLNLAEFFGRDAPLEIEVGCGKGLFIANAAAERPQSNMLGLELARKYARFSAARLAERRQSNAKMICGDGQRIFRDYLPAEAADAVHVYFPDPWWKKRHHKRRVMSAPFVRDIERVLSSVGRLHFWTDVAEYYNESIEVIAASTSLSGPHAVSETPAAHDLDYRTHFERRTRLSELPVYRAEFVRGQSSE